MFSADLINEVGSKELSRILSMIGFFTLSTHDPKHFNLNSPGNWVHVGICESFEEAVEGEPYTQYSITIYTHNGSTTKAEIVKVSS